jgi:mannose-6-phosphate isomerase-like protein (cupin superfamily)
MNSITDYIESGILELYVMDVTTPEETQEVEKLAAAHQEIRDEINHIRQTIETYALAHAVEPKSTVKPLVLASIDYMERMRKGEPVSSPPELTPESRPEDFAAWLQREDMKLPPEEEEPIFVKLIGYTPAATTAIVWIKDKAENEVHHDEHERFLILEGSCTITVDGKENHLLPGDYFEIPLHKQHVFTVTSAVRCKCILQRLAA